MQQSKSKEIVFPIDDNLVSVMFNDKSNVDRVIDIIRERVSGFEPDLSTAKSREEIASLAYKVTRSKTYLDGLGKQQIDDMRKAIDYVNAMRRHLCFSLDGIRDEVRKPLNEWEAEELKRVTAIADQIAKIELIEVRPIDKSEEIKAKLTSLEELRLFSYQEREEEALGKIEKKREQLLMLLDVVTATEELVRQNAELKAKAEAEAKLKAKAEAELRAKQKAEATPEPEDDDFLVEPEPKPFFVPAPAPEPEPKEPKTIESVISHLRDSLTTSDSPFIVVTREEAKLIVDYYDGINSLSDGSPITPIQR